MEPTARNVPPRPEHAVRADGASAQNPAAATDSKDSSAARSLRAQMLATEHWSLLASRSTTQSEVLTRIAIFLTLVSAGLVTLGILGQATAFGEVFTRAAIGVLAFLLLVGVLTQVRVINSMTEDLMYVVAMNRLRGAYADLDPGIERYYLASVNDDEAGVGQTYYFYGNRDVTQVLGSSATIIMAVNSVIAALLAGFLTLVAGAAPVAAGVAGAIVLVAYFLVSMSLGLRAYRHIRARIAPLRTTGPS